MNFCVIVARFLANQRGLRKSQTGNSGSSNLFDFSLALHLDMQDIRASAVPTILISEQQDLLYGAFHYDLWYDALAEHCFESRQDRSGHVKGYLRSELMGKDQFSEPRTVIDASAIEVGVRNNSDIENIDNSATPWHMAAEDIISYVITANASSSSADGIRIIKESQLDVTMKDTRTPDVCVALSNGVKIAGPIGEYLGPRSTVEYKSPADNCALETVMRSGVYTLQYTLDTMNGGINELYDQSSIIVSAHKPQKLFHELEQGGHRVQESEDYRGVYLLEDAPLPKTMFMVPRELDLTQASFEGVEGYEWFKWLRDDLSVEDGRALMRRQRDATDAERELATTVAYVALQGNPTVMKALLEETNMSDEVRRIIRPLVREEFSKELDAVEKEKDAAVREKDVAVREKDAAVREKDAAKQIISDMIASSHGNIDSSTLAKAQKFLATTN